MDWPDKYPWSLLPRGGTHPFVPPKRGDWIVNPDRGEENGYADAQGNEWKPHTSPHGQEFDFHWDVEHRNGRHTNIRPDGEIHHGPDNFP
jgi:hypothetical protein